MKNPMSLEGKNVIITGAASGIGKQTALLASELGARVILLDLNKEGLEHTASDCQGEALCAEVDVTDAAKVKEVLEQIRESTGKYHGLVHCAGIASVVPLRGLKAEQYEKVQKVNTQAGLQLAQIFSDRRFFDKGSDCAIVFISSVYGMVGSACNVAYAASKAAIIGITKALAVEFAPKGIRVNCVVPGFVKTEMADQTSDKFDKNYEEQVERMHLLGWGSPVDVANGIVFLLSTASKWTTGAAFTIDGGFTAQ